MLSNMSTKRPIVEKHQRFALYHPFAEALSSMLCDIPSKIAVCISFNMYVNFSIQRTRWDA